eukprot:scaffold2391_cov381-Prasinococcus_capsulatus_cf.AAC.8
MCAAGVCSQVSRIAVTRNLSHPPNGAEQRPDDPAEASRVRRPSTTGPRASHRSGAAANSLTAACAGVTTPSEAARAAREPICLDRPTDRPAAGQQVAA